jgi:hypothetical protein
MSRKKSMNYRRLKAESAVSTKNEPEKFFPGFYRIAVEIRISQPVVE